ncbi:MAG: hypothetical protein J0M10_09805 [Chitinophagales bacterium]|nr:hypothetical protein [Chitinophagales bacterium]
MAMPGRKYTSSSSSYRYGFNGKENDNEVKGDGKQQDYGMRIYDPRLGRFLSVDPIAKKYPWYTPYQFAGNKPIVAVDVDGLEDQWTADGKHVSGPYLKHPTSGQTLYSRPPTIDNPIVTYSRGSVVSKTANPSYQYMSWIGLPMGATITPSSNVNAVFKKGFSSYLPKRFIDHYELGKGQTYTMNQQEMKDVNMLPVGIQGRSADEAARFASILSGLKPGQSTTVDLNVLTGAATSGTLGNFYANFSGVLTRTKNTDGSLGWNFTGTIQMNDFWDFDPDPTMKKRPELAEKLVRLANKYLEGQAFKITSERVSVTQNSTQATTDYNNGQYQVVPNRVAKAKQDASQTTSED